MTGHDLTHILLLGILGVELYHIKLHNEITGEIAALRERVRRLLPTQRL